MLGDLPRKKPSSSVAGEVLHVQEGRVLPVGSFPYQPLWCTAVPTEQRSAANNDSLVLPYTTVLTSIKSYKQRFNMQVELVSTFKNVYTSAELNN